ncbi:DNA repair ATPase RecN [Kibdelosporangium banguiense]|uniref:DNA repair ATPase RecN n=1 Tax=Kibdelosporangium banguiense TaxID=1365924 RepID=A0ABS4TDM3_9PSEU|nr:hypothetical protein [Kibdelosporangium banguiense]MBP2322517.1 DNA repair ATPase RecN [Kibdelosporangium banguiense]
MDGKLQMDHDAMRAAADEVKNLAVAVQSVQSYITDNDLKQEHLGGHFTAPAAYQSFNAALQGLSASVGKAYAFLNEAAAKLEQSSQMTDATDVNNAWGLNKAGGR